MRPFRDVQGWTAALVFLCSGLASAASLTGTLLNPDGTGANGFLSLSLSQQGALQSTGGCGGPAEIVPTYRMRIPIVNGALSGPTAIYGNDCMLPANLYYNVRFDDNNGNNIFTDRWVISGASVDIGTIVSAVITGTTTTLGNTGVIVNNPAGNQTILQPGVTRLSVNNLTVSNSFTGPATSIDCGLGGCTFGEGAGFPGGVVIGASGPGTPILTSNSTLFIGANGNFWNRTFSGGDAPCAGIADGWMGLRTDTQEFQVCIADAVVKFSFALNSVSFNRDLLPSVDNAYILGSPNIISGVRRRVNSVYAGTGLFTVDGTGQIRFSASTNEIQLNDAGNTEKWFFSNAGTLRVQGLSGISTTLSISKDGTTQCDITITAGVITGSTC